ncbi:sigma 54-interacting transcriptional regulator, partial [Salmonella enterica subsp. enterica serovar Kentucky]|nr:sigma 54-interacting transcriptional regulator [Salmonella enterica subsp. enterica serovar Kentucky]
IGEMSPRMQAKLLRFLNDGTFRRVGEDHEIHVDVRVICATQKLVDHAAGVSFQTLAPDSIVMIEQWESVAHLEAHLQTPHMKAY